MRQDMREINRDLVTGAQYLISIVGTFFAVFVALKWVTADNAFCLIAALLAALAVAIAELYFIIKQDLKKNE